MSPAQVRTALEMLDTTWRQFAELVEHDRTSVWRWQTSDPEKRRAIPGEAAILLKLLVAGKITKADILALD
jgi:hypothetical protein